MKGSHSKTAHVIIEFDSQCEKLYSNVPGHIYLPCDTCGTIQNVPENTVSTLCPACYEDTDDYKEPKVGQVVKIYEDPVTCEILEGEASLISRIEKRSERSDREYWNVKFILDPSDSPVCQRWVNIDNHF